MRVYPTVMENLMRLEIDHQDVVDAGAILKLASQVCDIVCIINFSRPLVVISMYMYCSGFVIV